MVGPLHPRVQWTETDAAPVLVLLLTAALGGFFAHQIWQLLAYPPVGGVGAGAAGPLHPGARGTIERGAAMVPVFCCPCIDL